MTKRFLLFIVFTLALLSQAIAQESSYKLLVFEGSDWCSNCIRFNKTIMTDKTVSLFLSEHNIEREHIDFPQRKELDAETKSYNASVAEKYNFKGLFPTILLVDNETDAVVEIVYQNQDSKTFIDLLKSYIKSDE